MGAEEGSTMMMIDLLVLAFFFRVHENVSFFVFVCLHRSRYY